MSISRINLFGALKKKIPKAVIRRKKRNKKKKVEEKAVPGANVCVYVYVSVI
jgi:hypothetical protein